VSARRGVVLRDEGSRLVVDLDGEEASCVLRKGLVRRAGKLVKAVCKGAQVDYDLGAAETSVDVVLRSGTTNRYCTNFSAGSGCTTTKNGSDGKTYKLSDYKSKQAVVLAWFPKAFTGG